MHDPGGAYLLGARHYAYHYTVGCCCPAGVLNITKSATIVIDKVIAPPSLQRREMLSEATDASAKPHDLT